MTATSCWAPNKTPSRRSGPFGALQGTGPRLLRLEFLRGDYSQGPSSDRSAGCSQRVPELCGSVIRVFIVAASSLAGRDCKVCSGHGMWKSLAAPNFESLAGQWPDGEADIVLVDAAGEQLEGVLDSLAASQIASEAAIVVLSDHTEPRLLAEALRAGVRAVLPSDISPDQLVAALEAASAGLIVMHPVEVDAMFPAAQPASRRLAELAEPLTPRESEVLQMLASGLANKQIAAKLAISEHTVKFTWRRFSASSARGAAPKLSLSHSSRPRSSMTVEECFF